ncbi:MAG: 2-oxoglutarate dehydrogenase complex dihydrolipoyllysine-residue succinyltransferase [Candidatus Sumerlaeaceae bacterium]|jgi:2-oxoglutarate dehydrogenase E2 component (dihydrolipoamide succinyltransferase)
MATVIKVPSFGESITESTVAQWHKADGDWVEKGETLVTLDTEKSSADLEAEVSGRLRILVKEGTDVPIGTVIGEIDETATKPTAAEVSGSPASLAKGAEEHKKAVQELASLEQAPPGTAFSVAPESPSAQSVDEKRASVESWKASATESADETEPTRAPMAKEKSLGLSYGERSITRKPMSRLRKTIARRLLEARQQTAMLTTFAEVDMSAVLSLRARYQDTFLARHGVKLGLMSFFVKAVIEGLRAFPELNASLEGDDIVYHHYYDISIAVSTDRGLVVPVLRDADKKSFAEIEKEIAELAARARENKLALTELEGGTFTITNGGIFGSLLSTPLLNPPQVGILGMHAIADRPVAIEGRVEIRPMMYLALSYDHRLIDGREAVQFLGRVKECVAAPERLVLGL